MKCEKKREAKDDPKVLIQAIKIVELPVTELGKTTGRAACGGVTVSHAGGICGI